MFISWCGKGLDVTMVFAKVKSTTHCSSVVKGVEPQGQHWLSITLPPNNLPLKMATSSLCRGKLSLCVWLPHDNTPVHKSLVAQQAIRDCGFVLGL